MTQVLILYVFFKKDPRLNAVEHHFHWLHEHLDIIRKINEESLPLHIASDQTKIFDFRVHVANY